MSHGLGPEQQERLRRLRQEMLTAGVDLAVLGPTSEIRYFFDYAAHAIDRVTVMLVSSSAAVMVLPDFDLPEFVAHSGYSEAIGWSDMDGPGGALREALARLGLPGSSCPRWWGTRQPAWSPLPGRRSRVCPSGTAWSCR